MRRLWLRCRRRWRVNLWLRLWCWRRSVSLGGRRSGLMLGLWRCSRSSLMLDLRRCRLLGLLRMRRLGRMSLRRDRSCLVLGLWRRRRLRRLGRLHLTLPWLLRGLRRRLSRMLLSWVLLLRTVRRLARLGRLDRSVGIGLVHRRQVGLRWRPRRFAWLVAGRGLRTPGRRSGHRVIVGGLWRIGLAGLDRRRLALAGQRRRRGAGARCKRRQAGARRVGHIRLVGARGRDLRARCLGTVRGGPLGTGNFLHVRKAGL